MKVQSEVTSKLQYAKNNHSECELQKLTLKFHNMNACMFEAQQKLSIRLTKAKILNY